MFYPILNNSLCEKLTFFVGAFSFLLPTLLGAGCAAK